MKILILEKDMELGRRLFAALRINDYSLDWTTNPKDAEYILKWEKVDLMIFDLSRKTSGQVQLDMLCRLKNIRRDLPVILITESDRNICQFRDCAEVVATHPVDIERIARHVVRLLHKGADPAESRIRVDGLEVDLALRRVTRNGSPLILTNKEYSVLRTLVIAAGKTVSRRALMDNIYEWSDEIESNTLEVYIHKLRSKIGRNRIKTIRGEGYMLSDR